MDLSSRLVTFYPAATKSLQSCPTLCDPIDGSPSGSPVPGILQARTLEWVAISSSNAWRWKVKVKSLSRVRLLAHGLQPTRLLHPWDFPGKSTGVGCHCLLHFLPYPTVTPWNTEVIFIKYKAFCYFSLFFYRVSALMNNQYYSKISNLFEKCELWNPYTHQIKCLDVISLRYNKFWLFFAAFAFFSGS